jgi:glycosyltransferase involved in cell wall biosynthesis
MKIVIDKEKIIKTNKLPEIEPSQGFTSMSDKMSVEKSLFILPIYKPALLGGVSISISEIVQKVSQAGDVSVLTTSSKIPTSINLPKNKWITYEGVKTYYYKTNKPEFSLGFVLRGILEIKKFDSIQLNSLFFFPNLIFIICSKILGKKVFLTPHGELLEPALEIKNWKKKPYLVFFKLIINGVIFRATSKFEYDAIHSRFPKSSVVLIPNFFKFDEPLSLPRKNEFVFLGRISQIKMIENIILACSISDKFKNSDYKFIIAGPSENGSMQYKKKLEDLILSENLSSKVQFIGELNFSEKNTLLSSAKALILISKSENFGNVVVEALAQGTPVIASKGTPWEDIKNNKCGFWIDNTPSSVAQAMEQIINMSEVDFNEMSSRALHLSKNFNIDNLLPIWDHFVKSPAK